VEDREGGKWLEGWASSETETLLMVCNGSTVTTKKQRRKQTGREVKKESKKEGEGEKRLG
jgi:hypothetical protein